MPYLKCVPCKVRVSATGADTAVADGSCPNCGSALEPVADLTEVVGFRSPDLLDPASPAEGAERVADISGGKRVAEAQAEVDRWFDEGGSLGLQPLAKAIALEPTQR